MKYFRKYLWLVIAVAALAFIVVAIIFTGDSASKKPVARSSSPCGNYRRDLLVRISGQTIAAEVPRDAAAFQKGLGDRPCIMPNQGMLFAFKTMGQYRFWMKDMRFPIDIVWINSAHKVAALEIDVEPSTYHSSNPYFINDKNHLAQYVLEIKANLSRQLKIGLGTPVQF